LLGKLIALGGKARATPCRRLDRRGRKIDGHAESAPVEPIDRA
jgi:hypothetical protein